MSHADFFRMARLKGEEIHAWTEDEVMAQPYDEHWFYGLSLDEEGQEFLAEIIPPYGAAHLEEPFELSDEELKAALADCWEIKPVYSGKEAELRAAATRAHHDQFQAEVETRARLDCQHSALQSGPGGQGAWCPNCWRYFRPDEPEELPPDQLQIVMPPRIFRSLSEKLDDA